MKKNIGFILLAIFLSNTVHASELKTEQDELSYSFGVLIGSRFIKNHKDIDFDKLIEGMKAAYKGEKTLLAEAEASTIIRNAQKTLFEATKKEGIAKGKAFLDENAKKEGVVTTASGLQYKIIKKGTGDSPASTDKVVAHYRGTLLNGDEFDSSYQRKEPSTFSLNQVIPGWTEGLQLMKPGAKYTLYIPSKLAYGERGTRGKIGPNQTLIFDIELISVEKAAPAKEPTKEAVKEPAKK